MVDRTLAALGLAQVPHEDPLLYPGTWPRGSGLLDGDRLLPLDRLVHDDRTPVLTVGCNACPGQLRHKLDTFGITTPVPMVRTHVAGVDVGVSAHVSRAGYVSAAPFRSLTGSRALFVLWLDAEQLTAIDTTEGATLPQGNFARVWLPAPAVRVTLPDGHVLPGAYCYTNRHGVLRDGTRTPRRHPGQRPLLTALLRQSPPLRDLLGSTPEEFCARARSDATLRARAARLFTEEDLITTSGLEQYA
ncbi:hypothetical protein [Streptomyces sp. NPDC014805]|uniref:hypothetical protein n=1 Tax=Streptomyces sp. NPDC014805 TaxID=3364919 RepID=UPI0036FC469A